MDDEGNAATSQQHRSCLPKSTAFNSSVGPFSITSMLIASGMTSNDHEDNAQSILDDHVSHIWNSSGVTPSRSPPGRLTPDHQRRETAHVHASASSKLRPKEVGAEASAVVFPAHGKDGKFVHPSSSKNQQHSGKDFRSFPARDVEPGAQSRRHQVTSAGGVPIPVQSRAVPLYHPSRPGGDDPRHSGTRQAMQNVDDLGPGITRMETSAVERHMIPTSSSTKKYITPLAVRLLSIVAHSDAVFSEAFSMLCLDF